MRGLLRMSLQVQDYRINLYSIPLPLTINLQRFLKIWLVIK